jgi:hypothetical protein
LCILVAIFCAFLFANFCAVVVTDYKDGLDADRINLGAIIFLIMFLFHLRVFLKGNKVQGNLIKEIIIDEQTISLAVYSPFNKSEKSYIFNRKAISLERGIAKELNKLINIFDVADTYTLSVKTSKKNHFYFITSYWLEWPKIKRIIENEQS